MPRDLTLSLVAGLMSSLLFISVGKLGLIAIALPYFSILPLMLVGLAKGLFCAILATAIAIFIVLIVDGFLFSIVHLLAIAIPAVAITRQALFLTNAEKETKWQPQDRSLVSIVALACTYFIIAATLLSIEEPGIIYSIEQFLWRGAEFMLDDPSGREGEQFIQSLAYAFPAILSTLWAIMVVVNAVLAQGILVRCGANIRPSPNLSEMTVSTYLVIPLALSVAAALMPNTIGFIGTGLAAIFCIPYFFLGLAVIHVVSRSWPLRGLLLGLVYVVVGLSWLSLEVWAALFVVTLGTLEQWVGIRARSLSLNNHSNNPLG
tara:strand:+ start:17 stop:973 length:957 start_codon:yes stop_codon:yes gene_type:complete